MLKLARWSTTHRKYVLIGWIVLLAITFACAKKAGRNNVIDTAWGLGFAVVAVVTFVVAGAVAWAPGSGRIVGGIAGGYAGAAIARRVEPRTVRWLVLGVTPSSITTLHTMAAQDLASAAPQAMQPHPAFRHHLRQPFGIPDQLRQVR